jgi:3-oxoacyl-[acyl-carrier-protein] synthase-3
MSETVQNFVFAGFGHAYGKYKITNDDLAFAARSNYLKGFREDKILASSNYKKFLETHPGVTPFSYFAEYKMGFRTRHHVTPFPPGEKQATTHETSLDLAVRAVDKALQNADIHPENIDAWFFSTVSPHEQAPGIAATVKCYFTKFTNQNPTMTLTSGCSGFVLNLERALDFMASNPEVKNIIVAHTETMSSFLWNLTHYVPFATFGDAAAAIVISKVEGSKKEGLVKISNRQDLNMIGFVGVDKEWNLYMTDTVVKDRAVENITSISKIVLENTKWNVADIDLVIPHQTGNFILHESADKLQIPLSKLYQEVQLEYGNISGTCIPMCFSVLNEEEKLKPGMKLFSATAGVGGTFGAFSYIVPEKIEKSNTNNISKDLSDRLALVTGCTGGIGFDVCIELAKRGCDLLMHYGSDDTKAQLLEKQIQGFNIKYKFIKADFSDTVSVENFIQTVLDTNKKIDFLVHTAAISGGLARATDVSDIKLKNVTQVNQFAPVEITKKLKNIISSVILYTGSVAEDAQFTGSTPYVQSKKGLHGFAASFAYEARSSGIRSLYYMPGLVSGGMANELEAKHIADAKMSINQEGDISIQEVAERMVKSLYIPKVLSVHDSYEGALLVRRDGFCL